MPQVVVVRTESMENIIDDLVEHIEREGEVIVENGSKEVTLSGTSFTASLQIVSPEEYSPAKLYFDDDEETADIKFDLITLEDNEGSRRQSSLKKRIVEVPVENQKDL